MDWIKGLGFLLVALAVLIAALAGYGAWRWNTATRALSERLEAARTPVVPAGEGLLHPAVLGLFSLTDLRGTGPEPGGLAEGELLRYLAEATWYPTALLPSQGVRWAAVDADSAKASLGDGAVHATLLFRFDPQSGGIASVRAEARGRTVGDKVVLMPWEGRWSGHAERSGMLVPLGGEVAWLTGEGRRSYWRGAITALEHEWAK